MKTIYLVRHGEVENPTGVFYNSEYQLSQKGVQDVQVFAKHLDEAGIRPQKMVSSPAVRTRETAEIIAQQLNLSVDTDERLLEWNVGPWFGKPLQEFRQAAGYLDPPPFKLKLHDIENFDELSARVVVVIEEQLAAIAEDESVMLVSHREPMVSAILRLRGEEDWRNIPNLKVPKPSLWELVFEGEKLVTSSPCVPGGFSVS